jgi:PAS domain S-box-containing protein
MKALRRTQGCSTERRTKMFVSTIAHETAHPPGYAPLWLRLISLGTLFASIAFLFLAIGVKAHGTQGLGALVPRLFITLSLAISLAAYSLWNLRRDHRRTDHAFRNTACEFSSVFQTVLDGILILDDESNCLDANPAAASILRISSQQLIGRKVSRFFEDSDAFSQTWRSFLQKKNQRGRAKLVATDGTDLFVDFTATANYLPGRHIFIICDVTGRTRAELSLQESEKRFQHMANNIQEIFWMMDAGTKELVYVNQAYVTITGNAIESLYENPSSYQELIHPQDRIRVRSKLEEAVNSGSFDEELQFVHASGTVRWIWVKAFPVRERGLTRWLIGTAQDITSRKQAEKQIADHLDAAEAARAEAEALRKATLALSQNLAMDSVLDTLLQCIGELIPFNRASVLFVDDAAHLMVAREAAHNEPKRAGFVLSALGNVFLQRILFEHKPVIISDTAKERDWKDVAPLDRIRSWLGIPLSAAGDVIGILSLGAHAPAAFTAEHLRLAKNLAVSAAVAIQNARIHERAEIYGAELAMRFEELREAHKALQHAPGVPSNRRRPS